MAPIYLRWTNKKQRFAISSEPLFFLSVYELLPVTNARKELYNLVENVNLYSEPTLIVSKKGNAVLVSENDWNAIQETIYLNAIPGMVESIRSGMDTRLEDCVPEEDVEW